VHRLRELRRDLEELAGDAVLDLGLLVRVAGGAD
jgi:hypothetical protein